MSSLTAQVVLAGKRELNPLEGSVMRRDTALMFQGDPNADQTAWASGAPSLNVQVIAVGEVADGFSLGAAYTLTLGTVEAPPADAVTRVEEPAPEMVPRRVVEEPSPAPVVEAPAAPEPEPEPEPTPEVVEEPAPDVEPVTDVESADGSAKPSRRRR